MSDDAVKSPDDAPPTVVGQPVEPTHYVLFAFGPDGNFFLHVPDDEAMGRQLLGFGLFEFDRYYMGERMKKVAERAQQDAIMTRMLREKIDEGRRR